MIRTIHIEDHPIEIDSSLGWVYVYRERFGHDILPDLMPLVEAALAGLNEMFDGIVVDGDTKYLDVTKVSEIINGQTVTEMFIKLAGMEFVTILNIFWAMAKNANPKIEPPERFFNSFPVLPINEIAPGLLYAITESSISSKNSTGLLLKMSDLIPSTLMWSQSLESTED